MSAIKMIVRFALVVPLFFIGCYFGWILLAALPGIVLTELLYGRESFQHPEIIMWLGRPAMIIGGIAGILAAIFLPWPGTERRGY